MGGMKSFFIFDVESVGLHGDGFAVAGGVYLENGAAQWEFCFSIDRANSRGSDDDRAWVSEHIPPIEVTHLNIKLLRTDFWSAWMRAKAAGAVMAAECGWPVEARFLTQCIDDDQSRKWEGPYPLHEIASFMQLAGMDPLKKYERSPSELPEHHPLSDARLSARLLADAFNRAR